MGGQAVRIPARTAMLAVTGNAVLMGVAGVTAPIGWLLVPGVAGMSSRPRVSALLAGWAGVLIMTSVVLPVIPGHRGDRWSLISSGVCLALMPALAWARQHLRAHRHGEVPSVADVGAGRVARPVVLATSRLPGEVAAAVAVPGDGLRILIGMVMAEVPDRRRCAREIERMFRGAAARPGRGLPDVAAVLVPVARRYAPDGYVSATLVHVSPAGAALALRCGGPQILAMPGTEAAGPDPTMCTVVDPGPGGPPLGLGTVSGTPCDLPGDARVMIVTTEYAVAHYDDYTDAVHQSAQVRSTALAAVTLLFGPTTTTGNRLAGPALVLDPVTRG